MVLGVVSDMKNQKKLFTRAGKPRNQWKKVIKLWGQKLWSRFFIGSGIFHRSWTVFSDSPYQKLPPTPFHIASSRCYVPFPYFHVSHARHKEGDVGWNCYLYHTKWSITYGAYGILYIRLTLSNTNFKIFKLKNYKSAFEMIHFLCSI